MSVFDFSLLAGGGPMMWVLLLMGLIGLVLGPVLLSLIVALLRFAEEGVGQSDQDPI